MLVFLVIVVDIIGVGDSYVGGVLVGLVLGWLFVDVVLLGNVVVSWVVGYCGGDCVFMCEVLFFVYKNV